MAKFDDLSEYSYLEPARWVGTTLNIGWLAHDSDFSRADPDRAFVDRLWRYCSVSVHQTRGLHACEFCSDPHANAAERSGQTFLLGSAEIRVPAGPRHLYAAPNLIYHYVTAHRYAPPPGFVRAVLSAPCPPEKTYFDTLAEIGLNWTETLTADRTRTSFKFVKTPDGVIKVEV